MRHTVSGATGLVGSHLVMELLLAGKEVRALHRKSSDRGLLQRVFGYYGHKLADHESKLQWFEADLLDPIDLDNAVQGSDYFYHCAALVSFNPKDKQALIVDNVRMTAGLVNAALRHGASRFIHVSSVAALGRKEGQKEIDEQSDWVDSKENSNYAKGKYGAELEVWRGIEEGLSAAMVNPCIILGPGTWQDGSAAIFRNIAEGFSFYSTGVNAFVDVRDVVEAILILADRKELKERFVIAAENWSYEKVFKAIAQKMDKPEPKIEIKAWMSAIAWRWEALKTFFSGKKPLVTRETARTALKEYYYKNDKAKEVLGLQFRDLEESLAFISKQYLQEH